jgi:hypothetical protein
MVLVVSGREHFLEHLDNVSGSDREGQKQTVGRTYRTEKHV